MLLSAFNPDRTAPKVFYHILRILVGGVFIWASWDKIHDPGGFARIVENYQLLPAPLVHPAALLLPWIELICGVLMVSGFWIRGSSLMLAILLLVFIFALGLSAYRGIDISCGCFSVGATRSTGLYGLIFRDVMMLAAVIWISYYRMKTPAVS